jgi:hypothetical protein
MNSLIPHPKAKLSPILVLVLAALLVGAWLRFYQLGAQSLWYDEGNSAAMVGRSIGQIVAAAGGWGALAVKAISRSGCPRRCSAISIGVICPRQKRTTAALG